MAASRSASTRPARISPSRPQLLAHLRPDTAALGGGAPVRTDLDRRRVALQLERLSEQIPLFGGQAPSQGHHYEPSRPAGSSPITAGATLRPSVKTSSISMRYEGRRCSESSPPLPPAAPIGAIISPGPARPAVAAPPPRLMPA